RRRNIAASSLAADSCGRLAQFVKTGLLAPYRWLPLFPTDLGTASSGSTARKDSGPSVQHAERAQALRV
ncbi:MULTISPECIES: hypothetical protein, partial [Paraburkholderia]|uniref:hypothetical protein n=1 Tax=Paraburkholderia TaxID=1822464 RepID=UPI001C849A88